MPPQRGSRTRCGEERGRSRAESGQQSWSVIGFEGETAVRMEENGGQ